MQAIQRNPYSALLFNDFDEEAQIQIEEAPHGFGIMEPYYGPEYGFQCPPWIMEQIIASCNYEITLPYCKVCADAGKSLKEVHSHWVRQSSDPSSRVVCPTLLSQKCNYCKQYGHTLKYCQRLKEKEQRFSGNREILQPPSQDFVIDIQDESNFPSLSGNSQVSSDTSNRSTMSYSQIASRAPNNMSSFMSTAWSDDESDDDDEGYVKGRSWA